MNGKGLPLNDKYRQEWKITDTSNLIRKLKENLNLKRKSILYTENISGDILLFLIKYLNNSKINLKEMNLS